MKHNELLEAEGPHRRMVDMPSPCIGRANGL